MSRFNLLLECLKPLIADRNIPTSISVAADGEFELRIGGFYKDGEIICKIAEAAPGDPFPLPTIYISGRYDSDLDYIVVSPEMLARADKTPVQQIVRLNGERFAYWSTVKPEDFSKPDAGWLPYLMDNGIIKAVETTSYVIA